MNLNNFKVTALVGVLGIGIGASSAVAAGKYSSHPFLHRAQKDIKTARSMLQRATHDCGGHRATAIKKLDDAIAEVDVAVAYADSHPQEETALAR